jgi:tetratricopeptide (TPR) repeat protein
MRGFRSPAAWAFATILLAAPVAAQDAPPADPPEEDAAARDARAREHFQGGAEALGQGRYEFALAAFQEAYRLSQRPGLLYNIALAHDRLRQDREALDAYERYLAEAGEIGNRAEVERRVDVLRRTLATSEQSAQTEATESAGGAESGTVSLVETTTAAPADDGGTDLLPWVVIGASGAVAITGAVLFIVGRGDSANVEDAPPGSSWSEYEAASDRGGLFQTLGVVAMAAGLAGVAAGVGLLVLGGQDDEAEVYLAPFGAGMRGRF